MLWRFSSRNSESATATGGFTLLELIVVVLIISIIFSFALLSVGDRQPADLLENEARRLHAVLKLVSDESILKNQELALEIQPQQYRFLRYDNKQWEPLEDDSVLRSYTLPTGMGATLLLDGLAVDPYASQNDHTEHETDDELSEERPTPQVFFLSSGEISAFELRIHSEYVPQYYYLISGSLDGRLLFSSEEPPP
jgi:general secretion pathway protein H